MGQFTDLKTDDDQYPVADGEKDCTVASLDDSVEFAENYVPVTPVDDEFDHVERVLLGYSEMLTADELGSPVTGNEKYSFSVMQLYGYTGNEGFMENMKKAGEAVYNSLNEIIQTIKRYITGEGRKDREKAETNSEEGLKELSKKDRAAPLKENSKALDENTYIGRIKRMGKLENLLGADSAIKAKYDKVIGAFDRLENAKTVGNLGAVLQLAHNELTNFGKSVSAFTSKQVAEAEKRIRELRNSKNIGDNDIKEVKDEAKANQKEGADAAKHETAMTRLSNQLDGLINGALNSIGNMTRGVAGAKVESKFKG